MLIKYSISRGDQAGRFISDLWDKIINFGFRIDVDEKGKADDNRVGFQLIAQRAQKRLSDLARMRKERGFEEMDLWGYTKYKTLLCSLLPFLVVHDH